MPGQASDPSAPSLRARRVLVTGAATGIGAAAVRALLGAGASVVGLYRSTPPPPELKDACGWVQADASVPEQVEAAFDAAEAMLGGIDVLIAAAGIWLPATPETLVPDDLRSILDANLTSAVVTNQAAFRRMRETGGRIINLGSAEGVKGNPGAPHYAAAKAAVHAWTRSAATAWGPYGITVNAVAPAVASPGAERLWNHLGPEVTVAVKEQLRRTMPLRGELGDAHDDLGPVLVFLAGSGARFITGQLIPVDGGLLMVGA